ncbi:hypothetical protein SEA_CBORCH11_68 [Mycobacterium phage Cborch11]|nr:hypothetical protein SEA_CBORCH11_68 [Mycobacterium phage Cborch11]
MSRETSVVTTYTCNACAEKRVVGGSSPETIMDEAGWSLGLEILGNEVDLCESCTAELKDFINWIDPEIGEYGDPYAALLGGDTVICCCAAINPADGEQVCDPCSVGNHTECVGPL